MDDIRERRPRIEGLDERRHFGASAAELAGIDGGEVALSRDGLSKGRRLGWGQFAAGLPRALAADLLTEWERGTAFLFVPVLLACGAMVYFTLDAEPTASALALGPALLAVAAFAARRVLPLHLVLVAGAVFVAGMAMASLETWRASTPMLGSEITTRLTGRVVVVEEQPGGRTRLTLDVVSTERPTLRYAPDRVRATARAVPPGLAAGDFVSGVVRLMPPSGPLRPDGYDFSFESYFDGVGAIGFFMVGPERAAAGMTGRAQRFGAWVENARAALAQRIEERIGGAQGEIAAALVAGVRAGIPEHVNEALRRTGLAHVLSISGLHMALVAVTIIGSLRLAFAVFPAFSSRYPVRKYAAAIALCALSVYLLISGAAVAAERSFLMIAVMLAALLVDRSALTMRNLALAAIVVLAISPHEVAGPSFQMSFAATAALIGAYAWWSERRQARPARPIPASGWSRGLRMVVLYAAGLAATSIVAGLATTPYGAWHFQRVSPLSLAANLAAMPIVSVLVMPFAVGAIAAMPFGMDGPFLDVMGRGIKMMIDIAEWFSARTPVDAVGAVPAASVMLVTVALVIAALCSTRLRLLSVPFAIAAFAALIMRDLPQVLASEDGRLLGLAGENSLAVSRGRPNAFTTDNWTRTMAVDTILPPLKPDVSGERAGAERFLCREGLCFARLEDGSEIAWAESSQAAINACGVAAVLVIDDATASDPCPHDATLVITKRDLALRGSAEISITARGSTQPLATVRHAIGDPLRPWHAHRAFSRAARGLGPRQRRQ
ncbi:MAG: ComEC/Rec2 family competence protein [Rhizobiaceae bacterium]